jgi:lipopolysaccharide export LptBFGC system permease protein LptF
LRFSYALLMSALNDRTVLPVAAATLVFLVLHGLLWHARPGPGVWLIGSLVLGVLWGIAFMRLVTRGKPND